jgi:hypothetical protein
MKRIALALNALLIGIIVIQACNAGNNTGQNVTNIDPCRAIHCKPYGDDVRLQGEVDVDIVRILSEAYAADYPKSHITGSGSRPVDPHNTERVAPGADGLSTIFDLEKIKNLIWKMEEAVCTHGCDTSVKLGIRFYYIKYAMDSINNSNITESMKLVMRANPNKHALVMVPVFKRTTDAEWYDFDFKRGVSANCKFERISSRGHNSEFYYGLGVLGGGDNHGGVGPPPEPGTYPTDQPAQQ